MGCDIHLKLEKRKINKTYYTHQNFHPDGTITEEIRETPEFKTSRDWHPVCLTWKGDRVYGMFAKLADVRNYFQQKIEPIPLRGFPEDATDNTKLAYGYSEILNKEKSQIQTLIHQTGVRHRKWKTLLRKYSLTKK